jgi:Domain of unknown function (DUF6983)
MDQIISLTNLPNQQLPVSLIVDGKTLNLNLGISFNEMAQYWLLTIWDQFGNLIRDSIAMVTGGYPAANLLSQCAYLAIGSAYVINVGDAASDYPGANDWGANFQLLWSDTPSF